MDLLHNQLRSRFKLETNFQVPELPFRVYEFVQIKMRHYQDVLDDYSSDTKSDANKRRITLWFIKNPGKEFDRSQVLSEIGQELGIGQKSVGDYLNELSADEVLVPIGDQRISYRLSDDILIPIKYQFREALNHLNLIISVERWGIVTNVLLMAIIWAAITLPMWLIWVSTWVTPGATIGPVHRNDILWLAASMTIWVLVLAILTYILHKLRQWWV